MEAILRMFVSHKDRTNSVLKNQLCFKEPTLFFLSLKKKKKNGLSPIKKDGLSPLKEEPTVCFPFLKTKRKDQLPVFPF